MAMTERPRLARSLRLGLLIAALIATALGAFAWLQVQGEREIDLKDISLRAEALAQQLMPAASQALVMSNSEARRSLRGRLDGYGRLLGYAVFRPDGQLVAAGSSVLDFADRMSPAARKAAATGRQASSMTQSQGVPIYAMAVPVTDSKGALVGVLAVAHDVSFIDGRATGRLVQYGFGIALVTLLTVVVVVAATWFTYERPLHRLADWMRRLRTETAPGDPPPEVPSSLLLRETDRLAASFRAVRTADRHRSQAAVRSEEVWSRQRLRDQAVTALGQDRQLVVVSNREPYMHELDDGRPQVIVPAGGLVAALDPVLQACGGVWIAHGSGDADRETADARGRLMVPPWDARYTLKRVWLTREEEQGYYYGFANEGLWPLCHLAHERPIFRSSDWKFYQKANERFAEAVLGEVGDSKAMVLVQDYQLALVPRLLKEARPGLRVGLFWHIPWPNPEVFRICPYGKTILAGILGADLVGFHLQQYCNNFLETVDRLLESRLDWDHFAVELKGHSSEILPFPISVQNWDERKVPKGASLAEQIAAFKARHKLGESYIAVGVDRVDYTKGLPERFRAIDRFLEKYPQYCGRFTFVELGAPSRTHIPRYREHLARLEALADEINWRYQTNDWKPIHFLASHHDVSTVHAFLCMASMCIVSSLHDGMNLVAKEYVAAKAGEDGVLVLSEFAGAARELADALIINPYDTEQFAEAIRRGVEMGQSERRERMERMFRMVEEHNVYRWAAAFITRLAATRVEEPGIADGAAPPGQPK
jgi:trehalose-6-phosphate synthase